MSESISGAVPTSIPATPRSRDQEPLLWQARVREQAAVHWHRLALTAIVALSAFVNLFQLTKASADGKKSDRSSIRIAKSLDTPRDSRRQSPRGMTFVPAASPELDVESPRNPYTTR